MVSTLSPPSVESRWGKIVFMREMQLELNLVINYHLRGTVTRVRCGQSAQHSSHDFGLFVWLWRDDVLCGVLRGLYYVAIRGVGNTGEPAKL